MKVKWQNIKKEEVLANTENTFLCAKNTIENLGLDECPNAILLVTKNIDGSPFLKREYIKNTILFNSEFTKISKTSKLLILDLELKKEVEDIKETCPETYKFIYTKLNNLDRPKIVNIYELKIMAPPKYKTKLLKFYTSILKCHSEIELFADQNCDFPYVMEERLNLIYSDDETHHYIQEIIDINSADNESTFFTCFIYKLFVE